MSLSTMVYSKLELLVELGDKPDERLVHKAIEELKTKEEVKDAVFNNGALLVETTLPSTIVVMMVQKCTGRRTVLQGYGESAAAVAQLSSGACGGGGGGGGGGAVGVVRLQQAVDGPLVAEGAVDGLPAGPHGLHVRCTGDMSQGCMSLGDHYDPHGASHGAPYDPPGKRHAGDLGNIVADETGRATFRIVDNVLNIWDIIGRSIAITEKADDFGRGDSANSKIDGDSGKPIACGIIARAATVFENPKRICQCDGVVVWDERDRPIAGKGRRQEKEKKCCEREKENTGDNVKPCCKF